MELGRKLLHEFFRKGVFTLRSTLTVMVLVHLVAGHHPIFVFLKFLSNFLFNLRRIDLKP